MIVIPAIDILDGNAVRLKKGDYNEVTIYNRDPVDQARIFQQAGFKRIHVVDLDGAKSGAFENLHLIQRMMVELDVEIQTGGGIRTFADGKKLLDQGISKVVCSSMAVKNHSEWIDLLNAYGERAILGLDLKDGNLAYGGWLDTKEISFDEFLGEMMDHGLREVLMTDISRDGMLTGPNLELYRDFQEQFPQLNFIASGGVSEYRDLQNLANANLHAVVVGRAYYEQRFTLEEMKAVGEG